MILAPRTGKVIVSVHSTDVCIANELGLSTHDLVSYMRRRLLPEFSSTTSGWAVAVRSTTLGPLNTSIASGTDSNQSSEIVMMNFNVETARDPTGTALPQTGRPSTQVLPISAETATMVSRTMIGVDRLEKERLVAVQTQQGKLIAVYRYEIRSCVTKNGRGSLSTPNRTAFACSVLYLAIT